MTATPLKKPVWPKGNFDPRSRQVIETQQRLIEGLIDAVNRLGGVAVNAQQAQVGGARSAGVQRVSLEDVVQVQIPEVKDQAQQAAQQAESANELAEGATYRFGDNLFDTQAIYQGDISLWEVVSETSGVTTEFVKRVAGSAYNDGVRFTIPAGGQMWIRAPRKRPIRTGNTIRTDFRRIEVTADSGVTGGMRGWFYDRDGLAIFGGGYSVWGNGTYDFPWGNIIIPEGAQEAQFGFHLTNGGSTTATFTFYEPLVRVLITSVALDVDEVFNQKVLRNSELRNSDITMTVGQTLDFGPNMPTANAFRAAPPVSANDPRETRWNNTGFVFYPDVPTSNPPSGTAGLIDTGSTGSGRKALSFGVKSLPGTANQEFASARVGEHVGGILFDLWGFNRIGAPELRATNAFFHSLNVPITNRGSLRSIGDDTMAYTAIGNAMWWQLNPVQSGTGVSFENTLQNNVPATFSSGRLLAPYTGRYLVNAVVRFSGATGGTARSVALQVGEAVGSTANRQAESLFRQNTNAMPAGAIVGQAIGVVKATAGQTINAIIRHDAGGNLNCRLETFTADYIGP